jgi:hypothetical protein
MTFLVAGKPMKGGKCPITLSDALPTNVVSQINDIKKVADFNQIVLSQS